MAKINELIKLYKDILTNKNNILDIANKKEKYLHDSSMYF